MIKRSRSISSLVGIILMIVGLSIMLAAGGLYAYGQYERSVVESRQKNVGNISSIVPPSTMVESTDLVERQESAEAVAGTPVPATPTPATPTPKPSRPATPAIRAVIPRIGVDTPIVESRIEKGEWQVPKFVAGHLEGTANPGENGNVVLAGHLESLSSGNVFARLDELRIGDAVTLFTEDDAFRYQVTEIKVVQNDDLSVVKQTAQPTLTMITCTGTFNILTRDYSHRLIVIAKPLQNAPEE